MTRSMMPPRAMSISARTLLDDTNAISMPEKNPDNAMDNNTMNKGQVMANYKLLTINFQLVTGAASDSRQWER